LFVWPVIIPLFPFSCPPIYIKTGYINIPQNILLQEYNNKNISHVMYYVISTISSRYASSVNTLS
jgi:hypothetical protein